MSGIDFISLCESAIEEALLLEARTTYFRRIASEAETAREARQTATTSQEKTEFNQQLKDLQTEILGELNYGTSEQNRIRTNDELEAIIHEISIQPGQLNLSGLKNLKPSVLGDSAELEPRTQNNALFAIFKKLKEKGKSIYEIIANKQRTGQYE